MSVVIHHNPDCSKSREVLAIIKAAGYAPAVIEYLKDGWTCWTNGRPARLPSLTEL